LLFNKKVLFSDPPVGFSVKHFGKPSVPAVNVGEALEKGIEQGKTHAQEFYQREIVKLREDLALRQAELLDQIGLKVDQTLEELDERLPDLVLGVVERVLPGIPIDSHAVEQIIRSLIKEFTNEDEALEVFLCPEDLALLKGINSKADAQTDNVDDSGFASAIAGIFDNLEGDDSLLPDLPKVRFFEDETLSRGDCQIKSRFGLLDGRIATKLRRIEEELKGDG